ncbi:MFS transporter [Ferrimicrobium sp.]|uniref:MFS transporter n=1 Tax=Ferrimicrobium sp. TaxID=2926050 RepID=UPI00260219AC|nr:MFS transporter [Ferrimicrobium sp.]
MGQRSSWRTKTVWAIAGSAFFADLGYQSVLAAFPLFLVIALHQPVWEYGLAVSLSYGGGALFSWYGAKLGDRIGHRRVAILGNSLIPLLSLSAMVASPIWAVGLLTGGWWARNLRSPSRRVLLVAAVPNQDQRARAFGFLHALDVGGGALAGVAVLLAILSHTDYRWLFLATTVPLVISTLLLTATPSSRPPVPDEATTRTLDASHHPLPPATATRSLLIAAALYGFTFYSAGFPVLTLAQLGSGIALGVVAFLLIQLTSALTGYILPHYVDNVLWKRARSLGWSGYLAMGIGSGCIGFGYSLHRNIALLLVGVIVTGFSLGVVETLEPTVMSVLRSGSQTGRGFGALSAARSTGTFAANLVMGLLYGVAVGYAYGYAMLVAVAAALVMLAAVPALRQWQMSGD